MDRILANKILTDHLLDIAENRKLELELKVKEEERKEREEKKKAEVMLKLYRIYRFTKHAFILLAINLLLWNFSTSHLTIHEAKNNIARHIEFTGFSFAISPTFEDIRIEQTGKLDVSKVKYAVIVQGGHDGRTKGSTGTTGRHSTEQGLTREIGRKVVESLNSLGYPAAYAKADVFPDKKTLLFISLHFDGSTSPCRIGSTVGYRNPTDKPAAIEWQKMYKKVLPRSIPMRDMNIKNKNLTHYYAFRKIHTYDAQVLIELAELTCLEQEMWVLKNKDLITKTLVRFARTRLHKESNINSILPHTQNNRKAVPPVIITKLLSSKRTKLKSIPKRVAQELGLTDKQKRIANLIIKNAPGASRYEQDILLSIGYAESEFKNIEEGMSRKRSIANSGSYGRGVMQWTHIKTMQHYGVANPWSIKQSTQGALKYIRDINVYWHNRGSRGEDLTRLIFAGYNEGEANAKEYLASQQDTQLHNKKAMRFYQMTAKSP